MACQATFLTCDCHNQRADFAEVGAHPDLLFVSLMLGHLYCPLEVAEV